jgi:hypothetical protein
MEELWFAPERVTGAADHAQGIADRVPTQVAHGFQVTEEAAYQHRELPSGAALGHCLDAWSGRLTGLSTTLAATAQALRSASAHYLNTDATAAADLDLAVHDLGVQ